MKSLKLLTAGLLALAVAGSAFAAQVKITGSTAFRKALYAGIVRTLSNGGANTVRMVACDPNFNNKTPDGAQQAVFVNSAGDSFQACLSGSVGGIGFVAQSAPVATSIFVGFDPAKAWLHAPTYAAATTAGWPTVTVDAGGAFTYGAASAPYNNDGGTGTGIPGNIGYQSDAAALSLFDGSSSASVCMADTYQDSSPYDEFSTLNPLVDVQEGTVTFEFAKGAKHPKFLSDSAGSYENLKNISSQNFQALVNKGYIDLAQITGNTANYPTGDSGVDVVLVGRNSDSGTRAGVFYETGVGPASTGAKQYEPLDQNGNDASSTSSTLKVNSFTLLGAQDGYDSGAFVKQTLNDAIYSSASKGPSGTHPFIEVGYVGIGDAAGTLLTYNGVAMNQANVINGTYTLWTTEHLLYDNSVAPLGVAEQALVDILKTKITATNSNGSYVNQGALNCGRSGTEGSTVLHN